MVKYSLYVNGELAESGELPLIDFVSAVDSLISMYPSEVSVHDLTLIVRLHIGNDEWVVVADPSDMDPELL
ncbi:MAG: hypothetical protein QXT77_09100 [Candidatus Methanomethylicaceae archaeon]